MDASWPVAGKIDQPLLKSADYLAARAHDFRVRIKAMMNPKGKKVNCQLYSYTTNQSSNKPLLATPQVRSRNANM